MQKLLKLTQQTFWQILGKIITSISTFVVLGVVARNYGEEGTGIFTLTTTYLAMFYLLADFGFNGFVLHKNKGYHLGVQSEWRKLLGARILWALVLISIAVVTLPFWPFTTPLFLAAALFGSISILASALFVTNNLIFQSRLRYDLTVICSLVGTTLGLSAFLLAAYFKLSIPLLLFSYLFGGVIIAITSLFLVKKLVGKIKIEVDFLYIKELFKRSWPLALTLALNVVYFRADTFMIAYFKSSADVGIYNISFSIFQTALVLPTFIMNAYYPMMLKSFNGIIRVGLGLLILACLGTAVTTVFAPFIINLVTGGGFIGSVESLRILSYSFPAYFLSSLFMWVFVTKGKYKSMLVIYLIGLIINLVLNFIYIPKGSYIAAAYITGICEYLILLLQMMILFRR